MQIQAINKACGVALQKRVDLCRRGMGAAYLCHPSNRVQRIQRGPVTIKSK